MEATRFEAISMKDAIRKVKQELGKDAVIISTREKEKVLTIGGKPQKIIEVMATAASASTSKSNTSDSKITRPVFPKIETREKATIVRSGPAPAMPLLNRNIRTNSNGQSIARVDDLKHAKNQNQRSNAIGVTQSESDIADVQLQLQAQIEQLKSELRGLPQINLGEQVQEMKVLLHDILRTQAQTGGTRSQTPEIEDIAIRLRTAGVLPSIIAEITHHLNCVKKETTSASEASSADLYLTATIKYILKSIRTTQAGFTNTTSQEIHCFVGPSGAGKTTSIAKIAAALKSKKNSKVAIISMDNMRVAAAEQLRIYSKILGVDFYEVQDLHELVNLAQKRYDCDSILIDTAGRSASTKDQLDFLRSLKAAELPIRFHLVLSATMKQRDLEETCRAYQFINPSSIAFTKLDESWSFGEIFNICSLFKIPISYFATGPSVPDDLEIATKERVVERLLRI